MNGSLPLPLHTLRVVDATGLNGELAGRLLGDFGADVIRLETPEGSPSRTRAPHAPDGTSLWFAYRNFNKRGLVLDLPGSTEDHERLREILASTDVFIESGAPNGLARFGLDQETLERDFPHLIVCSITDFGQTGPYAGYEATPETLFAWSGWLTLSGSPDKPPLLIPGPLAYDLAGIIACYAILCALVKRRRTGRGQILDVSALEALAQCNSWQLPNMTHGMSRGGPINQQRQGAGLLYPSFPTADGVVRLVVLAASQWDALFEWMGRPEAFDDPSWREIVTRYINADVLNLAWAEFFKDMAMVDAGREAQDRGVVLAPMLKASDVLISEHLESRQTFVEVEVAPGVTGRVIDGFIERDRQRLGFRFRAPLLGEHNDEVFDEVFAEERSPQAASGTPSDDLPLAGLRVVDFGHGGVGVEGARMLAEYGADVIKIETRTRPDFIRVVMGEEMTPSFASSSRSKRSFGVNTKTARGQELVHDLIRTADILVENTSTGAMASMGMDWETIREVNPNLTMASSQLMGSHGVNAKWRGYGPTIQAISGLSWLWNFDDGSLPPGTTHIHPDMMAGRICSIAGLLGVLSRDEAGAGFHAEMAQVENLMGALGDFYLAESITPGSVRPPGNDSPEGAPWGVFPCVSDGAGKRRRGLLVRHLYSHR